MGDPRNTAIIGHWDGWQPFSTCFRLWFHYIITAVVVITQTHPKSLWFTVASGCQQVNTCGWPVMMKTFVTFALQIPPVVYYCHKLLLGWRSVFLDCQCLHNRFLDNMHENTHHTLWHIHAHTSTCSMTHKFIVLLYIGRMHWHIVHTSHLEDCQDCADKSTQNTRTDALLDTQTVNTEHITRHKKCKNGNLFNDTYIL